MQRQSNPSQEFSVVCLNFKQILYLPSREVILETSIQRLRLGRMLKAVIFATRRLDGISKEHVFDNNNKIEHSLGLEKRKNSFIKWKEILFFSMEKKSLSLKNHSIYWRIYSFFLIKIFLDSSRRILKDWEYSQFLLINFSSFYFFFSYRFWDKLNSRVCSIFKNGAFYNFWWEFAF